MSESKFKQLIISALREASRCWKPWILLLISNNMENGITLPPPDLDEFMPTFVKNYGRIKDPQGKLKFYTSAMNSLKSQWIPAKRFLEKFQEHSQSEKSKLFDEWTPAQQMDYPGRKVPLMTVRW